MGYCVGNEQNNPPRLGQNGWTTECSNYWYVCNMLGAVVKAKAPTKLVGQAWQFSVGASPFTSGDTDYQAVKDNMIYDFWGLNLYGAFGTFFNQFSNYVTQATNVKPIIITEFGTTVAYHTPTNACGLTNVCTAYTTSNSIAWAANVISNDIVEIQANTAICAGACIMEWCDEWWKEEGRLPDQQNYLQEADCQAGAYTPSGYWDEEWWGLCGVQVSGGRDPKVPWEPAYPVPNPIPADYNGDGKTDVAVFEPATGIWHVKHMGEDTGSTVSWGWAGVIPVPGDYDGDRIEDIAIYDPDTGRWFILYTGGGAAIVDWGWADAVPVPAHYDEDENSDMAVFDLNAGDWYIRFKTETELEHETYSWGDDEHIPVLLQYQINRLFGFMP